MGLTTDIITGEIVDGAGNPVANVNVTALSLETQISRSTHTDGDGRYTILFPDGGGQYRITARMIGMLPKEETLVRYADEDRLVWNVTMSDQAVLLNAIEVEGRMSPVVVPNSPNPGGVDRNFNGNAVANLPIEPDDLNLLATLVPGVVGIGATDSTGSEFSVAGLRPEANQITLDGLSFGATEVPQEGLRNTRVITSTYDISRGRFSGGLVSSTSRSGSNRVQGSLSYSLRDDHLAIGGDSDSPFASAFTQNQVGAGVGGPIINNRLFAYISGQTRLRSDAQPSLTNATFQDLERLGVSPDSIERFISVVDAIGAAPDVRNVSDRSNDRLSGLLRFDFLASNNHTITVRGDWRGTDQEPSRLSSLALPETAGVNGTSGGGLMASIASRIGLRVINEARAYISTSTRDSDPFLYLPAGRVRVSSDLLDGTSSIKTLTFGGNSRMPARSNINSLEMTEELSWLPGRGAHRFKIGGLLNTEKSEELLSTNQLGTFSFNSLGQLESATPNIFSRNVAPSERITRSFDYAIYVGDVWRASPAVQLTYGLRFEGSSNSGAPAPNSALESALGVRTEVLPEESSFSPRAGFTWTIGSATPRSQPSLIVRGGAGLFRSPIPGRLISQAQTANGIPNTNLDLNCIGISAPIPDWDQYSADQSNIPTDCVGPSIIGNSSLPSATVFAEDFSAPKVFRTSLGIQRNLTQLLRLSVNANYARGYSQSGFSDVNLDTSGGFKVTQEADRPVFVDPTQVAVVSGAVRSTDSRIAPEFGRVTEIGSDLSSETKQLTVSLGGLTRTGIAMQTSYTWSHVRDQSSQSVRFGNGTLGGATTGGNPNVREWARSSFERKHSFLTTISYPFGTTLELTAIGRLTSGSPFTPMVATDINGDGSRNDRAFVFDDAALPGMQTLLANASGRVRSCLQKQTGLVATRNSCLGPWEASLDLQVNYRPGFIGTSRNVSVSLTTLNLLRGIDELLHGANEAKGWGIRARPDQTLLFVENFDPVEESFAYSVNQRFGATNAQSTAQRSPFQIGIQVRATFGPNRGQAALDRLRGGGGRGSGGRGGGAATGGARGGGRAGFGGPGARGGLSAEEFLGRFRDLLINPAAIAIEMEDSLGLSEEQATDLLRLSAELIQRNDSIASVLQEEIDQFGTNDPQGMLQIIRPRMQDAQRNARETLDRLRELLTEEQWSLLPERIRNRAEGGQRGQGRGRRPE